MIPVPEIDWKKIFHRRIKPLKDFKAEPGTKVVFKRKGK